jgi:hypothetical protein
VKHFELQEGTGNDSGEVWKTCVQTAESHVEPPNDAKKENCKIGKQLDMIKSRVH